MLRPRQMLRAAVLGAALLPSCLLPLSAAAQEEDDRSLFVERVDVNVVNVEVFVTDSEGRRVTGLEREDFELLQDGEPVEISNFFAIDRQDRVLMEVAKGAGEATAEATAPAAPDPAPGATDRALPDEQQLNLVVYVDHVNIHPHSRQKVLKALEGFLEDRAFQRDNVMLVGYEGDLDVVQPFTRDRERIAAAIQRLRKAPARGPLLESQRRVVMRHMKGFVEDPMGPQLAYDAMHGFVERQRGELRRSSEALLGVVRSLAGLPGRKALLYVSDGLPQRPGEELYAYLEDLFGTRGLDAHPFAPKSIEAAREDEGHLFNRIARTANANQVTLYTVDARGSRGHSNLSADYSGAIDAAPGGRTGMDLILTQNYQAPLVDLSQDTGGRTLLNSDDFAGGLEEMAVDFDSFYSLGFQAPPANEGNYHRLEVRVKQRPGLRVRHREGYENRNAEERVADRTLSSLFLDMEQNPMAVEIDFGEPEKQGRKEYLLPVLIRIPLDEVTLLPSGPMQQGQLKIFVAVKDDAGNISPMHSVPYPVQVPSQKMAEARGKEIGYGVTLRLAPGIPRVAVAVWDEVAGTESFVHKEIIVGPVRRR